jgi:hypothetical protein
MSRSATRAGAALALLVISLGGCRSKQVWSGAQYSLDGSSMRLAAEEPTCGCLALTNKSKNEVRLLGNFRSITTGEARLFAGEKLRFKFDWCSSNLDDVYELRAYDVSGQPLKLRDVIKVDGLDPWRACDKAACDYGALLMNLGETTRGD